MKIQYVKDHCTAEMEKFSRVVGYNLDEVMRHTEPPLQRVLREAGIGYFDAKAVRRRMAWLEFKYNLAAGILPFMEYMAGKFLTARLCVRAMQFLCAVCAVAIYLVPVVATGYGVYKFFGIGNIFGGFALVFGLIAIVVYGNTASNMPLPIDTLFKLKDIGQGALFYWRTEPIYDHRLPIPKMVIEIAAEIKMRATDEVGCSELAFTVMLLDSDDRRFLARELRMKGPGLKEEHVRYYSPVKTLPPPDPFLVVTCRSRFNKSLGSYHELGQEEFVVAYYKEARFDVEVELPTSV